MLLMISPANSDRPEYLTAVSGEKRQGIKVGLGILPNTGKLAELSLNDG